MKRPLFKRFLAYLLDVIIISFIVSLFSSIEILNPAKKEYDEAYSKYEELLLRFNDVNNQNEKEIVEDNKIEEENIKEENTIQKDDEVIEENDSKETSTLSMNELLDEMNSISYDVTHASRYTSLITLIVSFLYFVVFQYFNDGKTIGKALFKIKVRSLNDKLNFIQVLVRSLLINSLLINSISLVLIFELSKSSYMNSLTYVQMIDIFIIFASIILILMRKDARGLHDLIANTEVIYTEDEIEEEIRKKDIEWK